ncbi:MAG: mitochondrial fission ELM1 family protein [Pseudomonadota bacterium]
METIPEASRKISVVTDGRAGNETQALALAEALGRLRPVEIEVAAPHIASWAIALPPRVVHALGLGAISASWRPDGPTGLLIGAGRRAAPLVAAIGQRFEIPTVQLMHPQMSSASFSLVVAPSHDDLRGRNVISTVGALSRVTARGVTDAAADWPQFARFPSPRLAVLVGGPSRSVEFGARDADRLLDLLSTLSQSQTLLITPSRRTPAELAERLKSEFGEAHFVWNGDGQNPYPGLLGWCDAVLVTADSVNMASEAASTGLPVHIMPLSRLSPKLARFHDDLAAHGASREVALPLETWSYEPLAEADRVAKEITTWLGW